MEERTRSGRKVNEDRDSPEVSCSLDQDLRRTEGNIEGPRPYSGELFRNPAVTVYHELLFRGSPDKQEGESVAENAQDPTL